MKLLSFISDHSLLFVFLSLLWGTTDSNVTITTTRTTQAETTTTQKTTTILLASTTQSSTSLTPATTKSALENVQNVTVKTRNETSITLQWKKVSNADTYVLEFNQRNITITAINASGELMTYTVLNLTDGTRYKFSLFAVSGNDRSSGVNHIAVTAPRSVNVTVVSQNERNITLIWGKVNNISAYILQYIHNGSATEMNISVSQEGPIKYVVSGTSGTSYNFTLFSVFEGVRSTGYRFSAVTVPENIQNVSVKAQNETSITLKWDKVNNISTYILQYNYNSSAVKNISVSQEGPIEYVMSPLTAGTNYSFTVFTVLEGVSSSGYRLSAVTAPGNVQNVTLVAQTNSNITLSWSKINSISDYTLKYDKEHLISKPQEDPIVYVVTPLTAGTKYNFTLFTMFGGVKSSGYKFNAVTAPCDAVEFRSLYQNETSITLQWKKGSNTDTYSLEFNQRNITITASSEVMTYTVLDLTDGTRYKFSLFAVFENVISSGVNHIAVTAPKSVKDVTVVSQNETSITLMWGKVNNISTYILQYNYSSSATEMNISVSQEGPTQYVVSPLAAGTSYSFTLFSVFEGIRSTGYTFTAVTAPCDAVEFRSLYQNETSITLQWKKGSNTDTYSLEFNQRNITITASSEVMTYTVLDLTDGTRYKFSLFAVFENVISSGVNHIAVTAPKSVKDVTVVSQNETSITLMWGKVNNISTYILQYNYSSSATEMNISVSQEGPTQYVVSPLAAGTSYSFTLFSVFEGIRSTGYTFTAVTAPLNTKKLKTLDQNETSITLQWEKVPSVDMYTLVFNEKEFNITSAEVVTYSVGNLTSGSRYNFSLFTVFGNVRSSGVNHLAVTVPPMMSSVNVTKRFANNITLKWENMNKAWEYLLQIRGRVSDSSDGSSNIKVVTDLNPGTEYYFTLTTMFSGLNSTAYRNFTVTAIDCASADWTVTNSSIKGKIEGLFSHAYASNGSQISVSPEGENVSFTGLYPGATYEISLAYEKSSRRFLQCRHKITVLPPNLNAHCEYWAAGYSVLIAWNEPDGEWTAVEVNVSEKSLTQNRSEKEVVISGFQPAKKYEVSVTSLSGPDGTVRRSEPHVFNCETDPRGVIAGSVFAVLLFCLLVALVVFIFLKRPYIISRKKSFIGGSKVSNTRSIAISAAKFPDHFHQLSLDDNRGFSEEYEDLAPVGTEQTRKIAILPENKAKNRFSNVLPYDWCRVKLRTQDPNGTSDYINANYMPGYSSTREYIATQGPLPSTVKDFWRMIWEQRVKRIIMVTNCIEGGRTKCEQYWPADRKPSLHGDLQVTVRSEQPEPNWTLREFSLKDRKTSEERRIKHFHFTAWPDHGVPQGTQVLIQFRGLVRQYIEREGSNAPTVIHCSAGVGRTGTIIALDVLLQQLQKERAVGINAFVHKMRLNRPYMVQTESQYIFLHQCIMDSLQPKETNEENVYENADMIYVNATALHELRRHNANA